MWRSKKFIVIAIVVALVLGLGISSVALAQTGSTDATSDNKTLLARVAAILGIDQQTVENAFSQARLDMRNEALDSYLKNLVDQGKITQEQADQYKQWWQSKPDMEPFQQQLKEWRQARPGIPSELKDWQQARPDIPGGFGGRGFRGGMKWGGGRYFGGW